MITMMAGFPAVALPKHAMDSAMVDRDMVTRIVVEASELELPPCYWPEVLKVAFDGSFEDVKTFVQKRVNYIGAGEDREISDVVYASGDLSVRLVVLND